MLHRVQYSGVLHRRSGTPGCDAKSKTLQHKHLQARRANTLVQNSLALESCAVLRMRSAIVRSKKNWPGFQESKAETMDHVDQAVSRGRGIERLSQRGQALGDGGLPILVALELQRNDSRGSCAGGAFAAIRG